MATITEDKVRQRARRATIYESATESLNKAVRSAPTNRTYDVFLSHSVRDAEIVLGVKLLLEDAGRSVYVDWIEDPQLDRSRVTPGTAEKLRDRMKSCRSLIYLHTENSGGSKWMPWELGFSDGHHGAVAVLPVTKAAQTDFDGQEYLGVYPWVDEGVVSLSSSGLRVHRSAYDYKEWNGWVASPRAFKKVT